MHHWRRGLDCIEIADYVTLASLVNIAVGPTQTRHATLTRLADTAQALGIRAGA